MPVIDFALKEQSFLTREGSLASQAYIDSLAGMPGGNGIGTGNPGFNIDNTVHAVNDLGLNPNGNADINGPLSDVGPRTKVVFPPGRYRSDPRNKLIFYDNNILLEGLGDTRDEVKFFVPRNTAGDVFTFAGHNQGVVNATFDHSDEPGQISALNITDGGDKYFYNIQHIGEDAPDYNIHGPMYEGESAGVHGWGVGMGSGEVLHVENYKWTSGATQVVPYPDNMIKFQAPAGNKGTIKLINCWMANGGEHNVYTSRSAGPTQITGGLYENTANTNVRIEGKDSFMKNVVVRVNRNASRYESGDKSARGLRWENPKGTSTYGGLVENCDFIHTTDVNSGASMAMEAPVGAGGLTVRNTRFHHDDNTSNCCEIEIPDVVFDGVSFTGNTDEFAVVGNGDTVVRNSCSTINRGFTGCNLSNMSYSGCAIAEA